MTAKSSRGSWAQTGLKREAGLAQAFRLAWATSSVALLALMPGDARAFCSTSTDGSKCHPQIVRESLYFLRPGILRAISHHVNDPDRWDKPRVFVDQWRRMTYATADHFDNCNFDGGTERINERYLGSGQGLPGVVEALSPFRRLRKFDAARLSRFVDEDYPGVFEAAKQWAWVLHAVQDFYSHSNWVELGFTDPSRDLVDPGLDGWTKIPPDWRLMRGDVIAAQQPLPSSWRMEFPSMPAYPFTAGATAQPNHAKPPEHVPRIVRPGGDRQRLLISGHGPVPNPWNSCPLARLVLHDELNKDNRARAGNPEALAMAMAQTRHEWCRLLSLTHSRNTAAGAAVLMGLMVNPGHSPHPAGTACAPVPAGEIEVVARVTRIRVKDGMKGSGHGPLTLVFSGFTTDFRRSARAQSHKIAVGSAAEVPADLNPEPLRFCLNPDEQLVLTVQGWKDGESSRGDLDEGDTLLAGATAWTPNAKQLAKGPLPFALRRASDNAHRQDLEVSFEVSAARPAGCRGSKGLRMHEPGHARHAG